MKIKIFLLLCILFTIICIVVGTLFYNGIIWFVYPENLGYTVKGIDVARYQGEIDWAAISSQGIHFAFIKATEGSTYSDPMFGTNIVSSKEAGIYAGAYHYFSVKSSGKSQAANFIDVVSGYDFDLPPVMDFEIALSANAGNGGIGGDGDVGGDVGGDGNGDGGGDGNGDGDSGDKKWIIDEARTYLVEVEKYFGIKPIIYTTYSSYNAFLVNEFDEYQYWFRDLLYKPNLKAGQTWIFWQYSNRGHLEGIDKQQKYVDMNVFNGDMQDFRTYIDHIAKKLTKGDRGSGTKPLKNAENP